MNNRLALKILYTRRLTSSKLFCIGKARTGFKKTMYAEKWTNSKNSGLFWEI